MREEGEEEGSDTLKALKTKGFTISVASSFLSPFDSLSGEKRGIGRFLYIWGGVRDGEGKEEGVCCLRRCFIGSV